MNKDLKPTKGYENTDLLLIKYLLCFAVMLSIPCIIIAACLKVLFF